MNQGRDQNGDKSKVSKVAHGAAHGLQVFDVLGIPVTVLTPKLAVEIILGWAKDDQGRFICIRDVHGIMLARHDAQLAQIHRDADMITPDGMPIAMIGKMRGLPVERTCGPDLMPLVLEASANAGARVGASGGATDGVSHYFYGGRDGVAQELAQKMQARFPGLVVAGAETPPFRAINDAELDELARQINASGADVVWVGLSTPKQEQLMHRLAPLVSATLIGVGAAFDLHSGHMERAPEWTHRLCLEGVYRLIKEPKRLWRRYLVLAPQFVLLAGLQQLRLTLGAKS